MTALNRFWDEVRVLVGRTLGAWRSLLPLLLLLQILAWFSYQGSLALAAILSIDHAWIALGIFSIGFVMNLVVAVVMMRIVGDHLGSFQMVPEPGADEEDEGRIGLTRMLALTLLPLLAMYAAFGKVNEALLELTLITFAYYGSLGDNLLVVLSPGRAGVATVLAVLIGAYVLRRVLDWVHNFTGWRMVGILVTITEAFFVMGLVLAAARWFSDLQFWLRHREFKAWWDQGIAGLATAFDVLRIDLPAFLAWIVPLWQDYIFPAARNAVTEPMLWLAVAALVFGSRVVSVADLWRKGQPLSSRVPGARRLTLVRKLAATAEAKPDNGVGRKIALWVQETVLGDLDDKYLPTLHALRLVLKAGLPFLAAFVLLHNLLAVAKRVLTSILIDAIGGHDTIFWTGLLPGVNLVVDLGLETIRLTLLAVAFHRCLQLFRAHAHPSDNPIPAPMPGRRVGEFVVTTWRKLRGSVALLVAVFAVSSIGWMFSEAMFEERHDYAEGRVGEPVTMGDFQITVTKVQYGQFTTVSSAGVVPTRSRWVRVSIRSSANGPGENLQATLESPDRLYRHTQGSVIIGDNMWSEYDVVFDVAPEDIGKLKLVVAPFSETIVRHNAVRIDLASPGDDPERIIAESAWGILPRIELPVSGGN